ncbi:MAG: P1 family peptidase [Candidatus Nitrospinota bacterium M3_3B_026]
MSRIAPDSRLADVPGVKVGHWTDRRAGTGATVVTFDRLSPASVHVAGGAPGSQETELLDPSRSVPGVDAILLAGGSAFGLAAADGARRYLEERGRGFKVGSYTVPIVPAAVIFDLAVGDGAVRPGPEAGYAACENAESGGRHEGDVGAGAGARVAKYMGMEKSLPGGLASRSVRLEDGTMVGALMVVNAFGAIVDPATGDVIAAPRGADGKTVDYISSKVSPPSFGNTCAGVVVTDAALTKAEAKRVSVMASAGLARAVTPAFTPYDGDMIFTVSTGSGRAGTARVGAWAARLVEECVTAAVRAARG